MISSAFPVLNKRYPLNLLTNLHLYFSNNLSFGTTFTFIPSFNVLLIAL